MRGSSPSATHYDVLGIQPSASGQEIRKAYRQLVLKFHPDRNPGNPQAEETFKRLTAAYEVLSDEASRARYDLSLGGDEELIAAAQKKASYEDQLRRFRTRQKKAAQPEPPESPWAREENTLRHADLFGGAALGFLATHLVAYWLKASAFGELVGKAFPAALAAGVGSYLGAGLGRAFTWVAVRTAAKAFGVGMGAVTGACFALLIASLTTPWSHYAGFETAYLQAVLAGILGGTLGGALGAARGSLRKP